MPKYDSRFENFFLNLRLNRAEYQQMAAFTLSALREPAHADKYAALVALLGPALERYAQHLRQTTTGQGLAATGTVASLLTEVGEYLKDTERRFIVPNYLPKSPDYLALLPRGRAALMAGPQASLVRELENFLDAAEARAAVFPAAVRSQGRALLTQLRAALSGRAGLAQQTDDHRAGLEAERTEVAAALLTAYGTLLAEHARQPERAAAFFDLSRARLGAKAKPQAKPQSA